MNHKAEPRDVTPEHAIDLELVRDWLAHATAQLPGWGSQPAIPIAMVSAMLSEIERLRSLVETAQREVVLMAQSKVGEHCEHHRLPLVTLEYYAMRECPLCWKAVAEEASAELSRLRAVPPTTPPAEITWLKRHSAHGDVEGNADRYECKTCGGTFWRPPTAEQEPQLHEEEIKFWTRNPKTSEPSSAALEAQLRAFFTLIVAMQGTNSHDYLVRRSQEFLDQLRASSPSGAPQ